MKSTNWNKWGDRIKTNEIVWLNAVDKMQWNIEYQWYETSESDDGY